MNNTLDSLIRARDEIDAQIVACLDEFRGKEDPDIFQFLKEQMLFAKERIGSTPDVMVVHPVTFQFLLKKLRSKIVVKKIVVSEYRQYYERRLNGIRIIRSLDVQKNSFVFY